MGGLSDLAGRMSAKELSRGLAARNVCRRRERVGPASHLMRQTR